MRAAVPPDSGAHGYTAEPAAPADNTGAVDGVSPDAADAATTTDEGTPDEMALGSGIRADAGRAEPTTPARDDVALAVIVASTVALSAVVGLADEVVAVPGDVAGDAWVGVVVVLFEAVGIVPGVSGAVRWPEVVVILCGAAATPLFS